MQPEQLSRIIRIFLLLAFAAIISKAQTRDSFLTSINERNKSQFSQIHQKFPQSFITPAILIGIGSINPGSGGPLKINYHVQHTTQVHWNPRSATIDNYTQYVPAASVYLLDVFSVKPQHEFWQRSKIFVASNVLMFLTVHSFKRLTHVQRPDKTNFLSFPSGHTASAFLGADFMYNEFRYKKKWWIYSGYIFATATGIYRVLNNKHWLTDVIAGAGFGILSNRVSYMLLEKKNSRKVKTKIIL